jgi:hypothetical protein
MLDSKTVFQKISQTEGFAKPYGGAKTTIR